MIRHGYRIISYPVEPPYSELFLGPSARFSATGRKPVAFRRIAALVMRCLEYKVVSWIDENV